MSGPVNDIDSALLRMVNKCWHGRGVTTIEHTTARSPMLLEQWAIGIGNVLLLVGVLGFVPGITEHQSLFGIVSVTPLQNMLHIIIGLAGVAAGLIGA